VPALELDDGTTISESVAICRYLEALYPEPNLFGRDAREQAVVEMWTRRCEFYLANPIMLNVRHTHPALAALEVNISPLLALIGGAAFVVGLALQGTLSNFAQGLIILAYQPFDVGDVIDAGGVSGVVESMNMLSTTIRTFDNKVVIVPNGKIGGDTITNATASDTRRVDLTFGIGYSDDIDKAEAVLTKLVTDHPLVLADPAPVIKLNELADSSVNFVVRPWTKTGDYWTVYWDLIKGVKQAFDREGISIPFPQQDVHMHQA